MKLALIVNPHSGGKMGEKLLPLIKKELSLQSIDCHTYISLYPDHIFTLISELKITEYDVIAAMGGDGTNFLVLNALLAEFKPEELPPLAIIPVGSGNSFAKDLNIHHYKDGIRAIIENHPRRVDVCSFTQHEKIIYFVNLMGLGFVTDVAETAQKFKVFKDFSYVLGVFYRAINLKFHTMELEIDGKIITGENCFVEFCNSRYTGGNMLMAPEAEIDDGFMDVIIAGKLSRTSLLATLPKIFKGTHLLHPLVRHFKARKAKITTWPVKTLLPDGEIVGETPALIHVHHKMIQYL